MPKKGKDPASPAWTKADFAKARPATEVLPRALLEASRRSRGRPKTSAEDKKLQVTLRLDPLVIGHYRGSGDGWQTRLNDDLVLHVLAEKAAAGLEGPKHLEGLREPGAAFATTGRKAGGKSKSKS